MVSFQQHELKTIFSLGFSFLDHNLAGENFQMKFTQRIRKKFTHEERGDAFL